MKTPTQNPLLSGQPLPEFAKIEAQHVIPALESVLEELESQLNALEKNQTVSWKSLVEPLMKMGLRLHSVWSPVVHLHRVRDSKELRTAYETVQEKVVTFGLRLSQSKIIYQGLQQLVQSKEWATYDDAQKRIIQEKIHDAQISGVGLEGEAKEKYNALVRESSQLSTRFSNNVLDASKAFDLEVTDKKDLSGLPPSFLATQSQAYGKKHPDKTTSPDKGPWLVTLDSPCFIPYMENCDRRDLREKLYRVYIERASSGKFDNQPILLRILQVRKEKASLLGYSNYAALSLSRKMAESTDQVYQLLEELRQASFDPAQKELEEIAAYAKKQDFKEKICQWDLAYWAKRYQEHLYQYNDEELRPYFPLPQVLDGLFSLVERLFDIKVKAANGTTEVWHPDVQFFNIFDLKDQQVASFYLDPYSRLGEKQGGAWMDECQVRRNLDGKRQIPVAYLVCNSSSPLAGEPSLMTFAEVETLFHEFGHGLQHMLSRVDYPDVSGINGIEWDAIELPSQFMENWCYHKETLLGMAKHYKTKEPLPMDLFEKIVKAKNYRAGQIMLRQLQFSLLDMELHDRFDPYGTKTPYDLQKDIAQKTSVLTPLDRDFFLCSFSHIFSGGYSAGYYSYKWAEVLSADAFSAFEDVGLEDPKAVKECGLRFRETVLALGGSKPPMDVFVAFRGRKPKTEALLRHSGLK